MSPLLRLAIFGLGLALASCAGAAKAPDASSSTPVAPSSSSSSASGLNAPSSAPAECDRAALPQNDNACLYPACENGQWRLTPVGPRVLCELNENYAVRQAVALKPFRGDPGVCYEAECVPRALCVQRCGAALGSKVGAPLLEQVQACLANPPADVPHRDKRDQVREFCAKQIREEHKSTLYHFGEAVIACYERCGFPRPSAGPLKPHDEDEAAPAAPSD